jgi:hypothetical protein
MGRYFSDQNVTVQITLKETENVNLRLSIAYKEVYSSNNQTLHRFCKVMYPPFLLSPRFARLPSCFLSKSKGIAQGLRNQAKPIRLQQARSFYSPPSRSEELPVKSQQQPPSPGRRSSTPIKTRSGRRYQGCPWCFSAFKEEVQAQGQLAHKGSAQSLSKQSASRESHHSVLSHVKAQR